MGANNGILAFEVNHGRQRWTVSFGLVLSNEMLLVFQVSEQRISNLVGALGAVASVADVVATAAATTAVAAAGQVSVTAPATLLAFHDY